MNLTEEMIFPVNIKEEVKQSFLDYSVSVITDRALPDVRDGMKPVHRRVLYGLHMLKMTHNKPHSKSARLVGEVLGKLHPHGDSSVYEAMVRLTQPFSLNYPLVDGHGNFGSIDGDRAAAMRYTEARFSKMGELMLQDIDKDTVDWKPNFSEDEYEPVVLPARLPQLLINGTTGIAVGMACSFPSHNLGQTIESIEKFIKDENVSDEELLETIGGPDFPTGGLVINKDELLEGYKTGRGRIRIRGKYKVEQRGNKELLVFYEIPYMTKKSKIETDIAELVESKEIEGITDVRDESAQEMALVIEIKKGFDPHKIAEILFARTQLENTFSINNTCLVDGTPQTLSFKELIEQYVIFQQEVITRRTKFDLKKIVDRIEIIEGLIIALANIDEVIQLIKDSDSTALANKELQKRFLLNETQAKSVLAMRLSSLTKLQVQELKNEKAGLEEKRTELETILNSKDILNNLLVKELKEYAKPHIVPRRTEIDNVIIEKADKEKLAKKIEKVNISIDSNLVISFISEGQFKNKANRENSIYRIPTDTSKSLTVFMSNGIIYRLPVEDLQAGNNLRTVLNLSPQDKIINILTKEDKDFIIFLTKQGMIKKTQMEEYQNIKRSGVIGIRLREGDEVVAIDFIDDEPIIVMASSGHTIRFKTADISPTGRNSMGVVAIKLGGNEKAVDFSVDSPDKEYFITVSRNGFVKKTIKTEFPYQGRNGKGVIGIKLPENDEAFAIGEASDDDEVMFYGTERLVKSKVKDLSSYGRNSLGNSVVKDGSVINVHLL